MNELLLRRRQLLNEDLLPAGCVELEYLESDSNQWIKTDIKPVVNSVCAAKVHREGYKEVFIFGCRQTSSVNGYSVFFGSVARQSWCAWAGGATTQSTTAISTVGEIEVYIDKSKCTINGVAIASGNANEDARFDFYMFALNQNGSAEARRGPIRMYYLTLDNVSNKHDFKPILDSTGKPCMYDTIGKQYYYNQGTGEFSYKIKE